MLLPTRLRRAGEHSVRFHMWILKDKNEIEREIREKRVKSFSPIKPLLVALGSFVFLSILIKIGYSRGDFPPIDKPISWEEFFESGILKSTLFSVCLFISLYMWQIFTRKRIIIRNLICEKCKTIKAFDNNYKCDCGGDFLNFENMKWVEETQTNNAK